MIPVLHCLQRLPQDQENLLQEGASILPPNVSQDGSGKDDHAGGPSQGGPEDVVSEQGYGADRGRKHQESDDGPTCFYRPASALLALQLIAVCGEPFSARHGSLGLWTGPAFVFLLYHAGIDTTIHAVVQEKGKRRLVPPLAPWSLHSSPGSGREDDGGYLTCLG